MTPSTGPPRQDKPLAEWTDEDWRAWRIDRYGYDPHDARTWPSRTASGFPYNFRSAPYLSGLPHSDAIKAGIASELEDTTPAWAECAECGASILDEHHGRPRRYCSPACRQRAYRKRRARRRALLARLADASTAGDRAAIWEEYRRALRKHSRTQSVTKTLSAGIPPAASPPELPFIYMLGSVSNDNPGVEHMHDGLLSLTEAARMLGMAPAQLRARTERGTGPIPTKVDYDYNRRPRGRPRADGSRFQYAYSLTEIERWVARHADPETAMAYWLGRLWHVIRSLSDDELRAQLAALHAMMPEIAKAEHERVADMWANIGMVFLADAAARGIFDPDEAADAFDADRAAAADAPAA